MPSTLAEEPHWLAVLDFAEVEIRFNGPARAILDLQSATGSGWTRISLCSALGE